MNCNISEACKVPIRVGSPVRPRSQACHTPTRRGLILNDAGRNPAAARVTGHEGIGYVNTE